MQRFLSIWFPYLLTDRAIQLKPELDPEAFVLAAPSRGRMVIQTASRQAVAKGIRSGMVVADARALLPALQVFNYKEGVAEKLLQGLAEWALRFTPAAAVDLPEGLVLDISGCPHLWGGEEKYLKEIVGKLKQKGYQARAGIADTVGAAWAAARYGPSALIIAPAAQLKSLSDWPPAALRLEPPQLDRMHRLGLYTIGQFIHMPEVVLRRRFGQGLLNRIGQALGTKPEPLRPVLPPVVFQERLPCLDPIKTRTGIDMALKHLLEPLSLRLQQANKGLRQAIFKCFRLDGHVQEIQIGTNRPVRNVPHLLQLFEQKIGSLRPALGIELFVLEAPLVEALCAQQEGLWAALGGGDTNTALTQLLDRIAAKVGERAIRRYLPVEHYWPERSMQISHALSEKPLTAWRRDRPRPICLLDRPEKIEVTVPVPDYPPMLFIYKGQIHKVKKADGPERLERAWWMDPATSIRDYYRVEDEAGARYWLFRSGKYDEQTPQWFLHGYFP